LRAASGLTPRQRGSRWELVAESFLRGKGLRTLARNYHSRFGEIDLVMLDEPVLVFVEVRYRHGDHYGSGAETVTHHKQVRLISAARQYLGNHATHARRACRFDVVSIGGGAGDTELRWLRAAFDLG
jgi:putative endonuclease